MNSGNYQKYIWQQKEWPHWSFDYKRLSSLLSQVTLERGKLLGAMQALGFKTSEEVSLKALTSDVVKSSEIEGEKLNPESVRSSLARRLGIEGGAFLPADKNVDGVVEMVLDATGNYANPLDENRLFGWHAALFPTGHSGMYKITVAAFRSDSEGPMQVVSGGAGREKVHYEAPPANTLKSEMAYFLHWFNHEDKELDPVVKAGLAHLWFVTLHPFDDGNGRIGRAICDMALARADGSPQRFYSLSAQVLRERKGYYDQLEHAQKGSLDVTDWLEWFLECLLHAVLNASEEVKGAIYLTNLASRAPGGSLNERQVKMLDMIMHNFEGKLTTGKWATLTKCSTDTALRDIEELVELGALDKAGESRRGTHYLLVALRQQEN
jgi:Fic family protein